MIIYPELYPTTRYSGSKRKLLGWIWENTKDLRFNSVLDVFGGTASVSLLYKYKGKKVHYNDILKSNTIIGKAIIENQNTLVNNDDIKKIFANPINTPKRIQKDFKGIFYLENENKWLDKILFNINKIDNEYKKSILLAALFQACLCKRPFNLFHRANLNLRTRNVKRSFGNKKTWDTPFKKLFIKFIEEYNKAIFSNGKHNRVVGGFDALVVPNGVDLVYLDPPYFSLNIRPKGTNYLDYYHFLERITLYSNWEKDIIDCNGNSKKPSSTQQIQNFVNRKNLYQTFYNLIERFEKNIIVLSYQSCGLPSKEEIFTLLKLFKKDVKVYTKQHKYVLSKKSGDELLFVAT